MKSIRTRRAVRPGIWLLVAMTLGLPLSISGQTWQPDAGAASAIEGAELYKTYCASCHGAERHRERSSGARPSPCPGEPHADCQEERRHLSGCSGAAHHRGVGYRIAWRPRHAGLGEIPFR